MRVIGCRWPRRGSGRRQGEVDPFGVESRTQGGRVELLLPGIERRFELLLGGVEHLADAFALFGRELAHALADFCKRAFAAHGVHADGFEFLWRCGGSDAREGTRRQFLNGFIKHVVEVLIVATGGSVAPTRAVCPTALPAPVEAPEIAAG